MNWIELKSVEQLEEITRESQQQPVLILNTALRATSAEQH